MISVNSIQISTPSSFSVSIEDISKADRNANGKIIIERITTKRKLEMSWSYLTNAQLQTLLTIVSTNIFFNVTYPDPYTGADRTGIFYVGSRSCGAIDYQNNTPRWKDIKFNFIEQ